METTINGLALTFRREGDGVTVLSVRTELSRAELPAELSGLPVKALGDRAFAVRAGEEGADHRGLRTVTLPGTLERVGDYAFFGCSGLTRLCLTDRTERWGGSCLMNCRSLRCIDLQVTKERSSTLFYFANELSTELDVTLRHPEGETLRLLFPEYIESFENNDPAHHFDFHIYGPGVPYHHAFRGKQLDLGLYDGAWGELLRREHEEDCALRIALYRLRFPRGLSPKAREGYETYLSAHCAAALLWCVEEEDCRALSWLLARFSPDREALAAAAALARERRLHEAVALLLEEQHRRCPRGREKTFEL